jgi:isopentenyl-diphosphate delta-isomerase
MNEEKVILVNERDEEIGLAGKLEAHEKGLMHRAVSVVLFQKENPALMLIQQRSAVKYHSPLMWANTCCSHPRGGEEPLAAAARRVKEELAIDAPPLTFAGTYTYRAPVGDLVENEISHVFFGLLPRDTLIPMVPEQVAAVDWVSVDKPFANSSRVYTPWIEGIVKTALSAFRQKIRA